MPFHSLYGISIVFLAAPSDSIFAKTRWQAQSEATGLPIVFRVGLHACTALPAYSFLALLLISGSFRTRWVNKLRELVQNGSSCGICGQQFPWSSFLVVKLYKLRSGCASRNRMPGSLSNKSAWRAPDWHWSNLAVDCAWVDCNSLHHRATG